MDLSEFDEAHTARLLWAKGPDFSGRVKLTATPELVRDYRAWLAAECKHDDRSMVAIRASNGAPMYREQCTRCGHPFGQWVAKAKVRDVDSVPVVSADMRASYEAARFHEWESVQAEHARSQLSADDTEYAQYLRSEAWKAKRLRVLKRANGVCEGCGERQATQVHHLTYRHIQNEFLWELVAICDECHERVHPDEE